MGRSSVRERPDEACNFARRAALLRAMKAPTPNASPHASLTADTALPPAGSNVVFRRAERADAAALLRLIRALAEFEKLTPPDEAAEARLLEHGFGPQPRFEAWLAWLDGRAEPIGYAVLFAAYSTFLARPTLYLEDLFVVPEFRRRGIGAAFLHHFIRLAYERGCGRMEWTCLDWNTKAQGVYERLGAQRLSDWYLFRLTRERMESLLAEADGKPQNPPSFECENKQPSSHEREVH